MPRKILKNIHTNFFHVIVQGLNKEYIFSQESFILKYLELIHNHLNIYDINLLAYCIMGNHAHMLIECKENKNLSNYMKVINQRYAQYYNYKKNRVGPVFKGRFLYEPIYSQNYLLNCFTYIHNNPKKANIVNNCWEYKFSSYNDYINKTGIASSHNIQILFNTTDYINIFETIHLKPYYFLDIDITQSEILDLKIKEFEFKNSINLENILENNYYTSELINYLKTSYSPIKLSNMEISKRLHISINQVRYILKNR